MENTNVVDKTMDAVRLSVFEPASSVESKLFGASEIKDIVMDRNEFSLTLLGSHQSGVKVGKRIAYRNVALGTAAVFLAAPTVALWTFNHFQKKKKNR